MCLKLCRGSWCVDGPRAGREPDTGVRTLARREDPQVAKLQRVRGKLVRGRELSKVLQRGANQSLRQYIEQNGIERVGPDTHEAKSAPGGEDEGAPG
jgi:hypothetical protein